MAYRPLTTREQVDANIAAIETRLNQTTPSTDKSFNRVLATVLALQYTGLFKYAAERAAQNLATAASGVDLEAIGVEWGVYKKAATACEPVLRARITPIGSTLPAGTTFTGVSNGVVYTTTTDTVSEAHAYADCAAVADVAGEVGNLSVGDELTLDSPVAGADNTATVLSITTPGSEREDEELYRRRVLTAIRTAGGGGNAADYRTWAEQTVGVARAFPYSGKPYTYSFFLDAPSFEDSTITDAGIDFADEGVAAHDEIVISGTATNDGRYVVQSAGDGYVTVAETFTTETPAEVVTFENASLPGDVTVYIQAESEFSINPEMGAGVPTDELLVAVREMILTDPTTGQRRIALGDEDSNLYVERIDVVRTSVLLDGLYVPQAEFSTLRDNLTSALNQYFANAVPFIPAIDFEAERTDQITPVSLSYRIQDVLRKSNAYCQAIKFNVESGPWLDYYQLKQGQLLGLDALTLNVIEEE
jgi:hypothetical protein